MKPCLRAETEQEATDYRVLVFFEFLYLFMHITNRAAHSKGLTGRQIKELQEAVRPDVVAAAVDLSTQHWPQENEEELRDQFYINADSAELEYSTSKEWTSAKYRPLTGDSLLGKLSRKVAAKVELPHDPEVLSQVRIIASEELRSADLPKLVEAAKALLI